MISLFSADRMFASAVVLTDARANTPHLTAHAPEGQCQAFVSAFQPIGKSFIQKKSPCVSYESKGFPCFTDYLAVTKPAALRSARRTQL